MPKVPHAYVAGPNSAGANRIDLVTFECSKCEQVHKEAVANDPMKSDKVTGWLAGDLRPPE
jgi:hypothetical protein